MSDIAIKTSFLVKAGLDQIELEIFVASTPASLKPSRSTSQHSFWSLLTMLLESHFHFHISISTIPHLPGHVFVSLMYAFSGTRLYFELSKEFITHQCKSSSTDSFRFSLYSALKYLISTLCQQNGRKEVLLLL